MALRHESEVRPNREVAALLSETADLLEILGENPFKVRAYRNAARTIEGLAANVCALDEAALRRIPGVGEAIASKIREVAETGDFGARRKAAARVPAGVVELLKVEGLGPRRVALLWRRLRVRGADDLRKALAAGRVARLQRFGDVLARKVAAGLDSLERARGRFRLDEALPAAEALLAVLRAVVGVRRAEAAGSLRRRKETVKDIDLVVGGAPRAAAAAFDAVAAHPETAAVEARGPTRLRVRLRSGPPVDVRFVSVESYGALLQHLTGSKAHNVALRSLARRKGLTSTEYGLFRAGPRGRGRRVAGATEAGLYRALGLATPPPELREDRGEIEAAARGRLPRLVDLGDLKGDLHMHTTESDGRNTLEEMVEAARAKGYAYVAITEHSKATAIAHGLDERRLRRWIGEIRRLDARMKGIKVLAGVEVDVLRDGRLDLDDATLALCDVVIATLHWHLRLPRAEMTARVVRAVSHPLVRILAHPTSRLLGEREPADYDMNAVIAAAVRNGVALEVNASPRRLDLSGEDVRRVLDAGGRIAVDTDAHSVEGLDQIHYGVSTARRGGATAADVVNALPLRRLLRFLRRR